MSYHLTCYRSFTDITKLERAQKIAASEPPKAAVLVRVSLAIQQKNCSEQLDNRLVLIMASKKRVKQDLSLAQTVIAGLLQMAAEMRNDESVHVHIRGKDCVAVEARYHTKCYQMYTKVLSNIKNTKLPVTKPTVYDRAFDLFCLNFMEGRIINNKAILLLSYLLKKFIGIVNEIDGSDLPYQSGRLKKRIQSRYPQVVFHASKTMVKGTLVYSGDIVPGEIADMLEVDRSDSDEEDDDDEAENNVGESLNRNACDSAPHQLFHVAMEIRKMLKESKGSDGWRPDSSDLTIQRATESIPIKLFNFIAWTLGYSNEPVMDKRVVMSRSQMCKVVSTCQGLVYAEAKGKKQTQKSLALGMTVRQISGSTKLINILHGLGHTVSSSTVCKHDSALASISNASDDVIIPRNINVGHFTTIVWDSEFNEETLTGKGITHIANEIVNQRGEPALNSKVIVSKKIRTVKAPDHDIRPYISTKKGVPSLCQITLNLI
ncbi:Hypothetical predicted protein [Paramuricea clavata]|uniref:Uncharacterized protein n=1 Tax=Paramuricea clavata TaxID=317549 RepID=A0A7D9LQW6_PARCT|nr:Hypothetical predicted protein [Paramuricea clavata]